MTACIVKGERMMDAWSEGVFMGICSEWRPLKPQVAYLRAWILVQSFNFTSASLTAAAYATKLETKFSIEEEKGGLRDKIPILKLYESIPCKLKKEDCLSNY
ncbi:Protocadherin-12 [Frankliniella fusca]|uniref:Protocadherin-12 n=1 Tax=Frankliniella fusca TaxID=407009 RepID=A0AAE1LCP8_9NEOP|nr:Protocadherin-12 [Frankliniella fusca]